MFPSHNLGTGGHKDLGAGRHIDRPGGFQQRLLEGGLVVVFTNTIILPVIWGMNYAAVTYSLTNIQTLGYKESLWYFQKIPVLDIQKGGSLSGVLMIYFLAKFHKST